MARLVSVVSLALVLAVCAVPAAADNEDEIDKLTEKIEAGKFGGLALTKAYMERGTRKLRWETTIRPSRPRPSLAKPISGGRSAASRRATCSMPSMTFRRR